MGLRPPREGHEPGTWRAPRALAEAGLTRRLKPKETIVLPHPPYDFEPQAGTNLRSGRTLRAFSETLADNVEAQLRRKRFPIVVGGDCSILLGCLAGARRLSEISLVHMDGHSDFRHPGNYDAATVPGSAGGMDLALATGRGEALMTRWDGRSDPLVPDERVVQIGERESRDPDYAWPDVLETTITQIDIFRIEERGIDSAIADSFAALDRRADLPFWLHFDVDILDERIMPAVDSPGRPGLDWDQAHGFLRAFADSGRCLGVTVAIFDPDLDATRELATALARLVGHAFGPMGT